MRPIRLRFRGLHSYRDWQDIDFEALCEGGLFGIFGPTGSGKSTVLDAITLALYAYVERAGGKRQGILNDACDELDVDFTFELGASSSPVRYRVERKYRRSGPNSVSIAYARLTELTAGSERVVADKDSDVNEAIVHILGLTHTDFTRAVVLPQGKFAEFLTLTGKERSVMLERLFSLQAYGQQLLDRIRSALNRAEHRLTEATSAQNALGDASKDAVEQAKHSANEARANLETARSLWDQAEKEFATAKAHRELQEELQRVDTELARLKEEQPAVDAAREELRLAEAAEPIRRDLAALEQAAAEHAQAVAYLRETREKRQEAFTVHEQALAALTAAQSARRTEEPRLLTRIALLDDAVQKEALVEQLRREADRLRRRLEELTEYVAESETRLTDQHARQKEDDHRLKELEEALKASSVPVERRRIIAAAVASLNELRAAEQELREAQSELSQAREESAGKSALHSQAVRLAQAQKAELEKAERLLTELENNPPGDEASLAHEARFLERATMHVEELERLSGEVERRRQILKREEDRLEHLNKELVAAQEELQRLALEREEARRALEEANQRGRLAAARHQAALLATSLQDGLPCPVCGSTHHPNPARSDVDLPDGEDVSREQERLQRVEEKLMEASQYALRLDADRTAAVALRDEARAELERLLGQLAASREKLPKAWQGLDVTALREQLAAENARYAERRKLLTMWTEQVTEQRKQVARARQVAEEATAQAAQSESTLSACLATVHVAEGRVRRAEEHVALKAQEFAARSQGMPAEQIASEEERIARADAQREEIERSIAELRSRVASRQSSIEALQTSLSALREEQIRVEGDLNKVIERVLELDRELEAVTGGRKAGELLKEVREQLKELADAEAAAGKDRDAAAARLQTAEQQLAAAEERVRNAAHGEEKRRQELQEQLARSCFADTQAVRSALRSPEEREALRRRIDTHTRLWERLTERQAELRTRIGDSWIDDAAWERLQHTLHEARERHERALSQVSVAEDRYQVLLAKHEQWLKYEEQRKEAQELKDRLTQLQQLCRGNQFVEFVAEEHLRSVTLDASHRLQSLTNGRYALELDTLGNFVVRDDYNGGVRRPVSTLSGGETFVTSLALALALSNQIQLHGTYPLEFFFLDEGFGTLDPELLDTVITSLERLQSERVSIGIISHVPELRDRVSRRLIVQHARETENGSRLRFERS